MARTKPTKPTHTLTVIPSTQLVENWDADIRAAMEVAIEDVSKRKGLTPTQQAISIVNGFKEQTGKTTTGYAILQKFRHHLASETRRAFNEMAMEIRGRKQEWLAYERGFLKTPKDFPLPWVSNATAMEWLGNSFRVNKYIGNASWLLECGLFVVPTKDVIGALAKFQGHFETAAPKKKKPPIRIKKVELPPREQLGLNLKPRDEPEWAVETFRAPPVERPTTLQNGARSALMEVYAAVTAGNLDPEAGARIIAALTHK